MSISSQQIRTLKAESHRLKLKPVVMIGQQGLSENVFNELESSINHHELIKIRIPALEKSDKKVLIEKICNQLKADLIQNIGHVVVLFRRNPKSQRFDKLLKD
jgi:RNA-binding protein